MWKSFLIAPLETPGRAPADVGRGGKCDTEFQGFCIWTFLNSPFHASGRDVPIAPLGTPGRTPANIGPGGGLPGARIAAFSGYPAVAAQRPQSHLSERPWARVMTLQRSETMQGRKNAPEREGRLTPVHVRQPPRRQKKRSAVAAAVVIGKAFYDRIQGLADQGVEIGPTVEDDVGAEGHSLPLHL